MWVGFNKNKFWRIVLKHNYQYYSDFKIKDYFSSYENKWMLNSIYKAHNCILFNNKLIFNYNKYLSDISDNRVYFICG